MTLSPASLVMMNSMVGVMFEKAAVTTKELLMVSVFPTVMGQPLAKALHPSTT